MKKRLIKMYENPSYVSEFLEHLMAVLVLIAIVISTLSLKDSFIVFWNNRMHEGAFLHYIDSIFKIVIGIEFFKLLWKPEKDTLVEVLMFVLARHMIIEHTTALENCISVAAIGLLFLMDHFLLVGSHKSNTFHVSHKKYNHTEQSAKENNTKRNPSAKHSEDNK